MRCAVEALESEDLFLSVVSIGELAKGIALLKDTKKKDDLLARDAVYLSVMKNGIHQILSFDSGLDAFPAITRLS